MKKLFIPYTESVILKELGFNDECLAYFDDEILKSIDTDFISFAMTPSSRLSTGLIKAPLYTQIFKWFLDNYGFHINIGPEFYKDGINYCWQILWYLPKDKWSDHNIHGGTMSYGDNHEYPTKEDAELGLLQKMIELIIDKSYIKSESIKTYTREEVIKLLDKLAGEDLGYSDGKYWKWHDNWVNKNL